MDGRDILVDMFEKLCENKEVESMTDKSGLPDYAAIRMNGSYEAMQIAKILFDHFKEDFENQTRDSSDLVRQRAYNLFVSSIL